MRNFLEEQVIFRGTAVLQAAFTAAVTDIITSNAHGLQNGGLVQLTTTDTLPAGLSASTDYYVIEATTNTFKLSATKDGAAVNVTDTGTGTHTFHLKGVSILVANYRHVEISVVSANSASLTYKFQASQQTNVDFNAAASITNRWDYMKVVNKNTGTKTNGDTGITLSGTDSAEIYELDDNASYWMTVVITSWTAGTLDIRVTAYDGE